MLALWVGGRRERRARAAARESALARFVLEMRHNAVLQSRGARMVDALLPMGPLTRPAGLPPSLSTAALEALPADAYAPSPQRLRLVWRAVPVAASVLYLASLRLQIEDWNRVVRLWEIQPAYINQDAGKVVLAGAAFGAFMGLQQVVDLLSEQDAAYVRRMTWCSDLLADTVGPIPSDWLRAGQPATLPESSAQTPEI